MKRASAWIFFAIIVSIAFWASIPILLWYSNGLREDNVKKNKEVCELKAYKQAWLDFNKSFILSTALPRCPEIEAIYEEKKR